jgi:hypothetical protein
VYGCVCVCMGVCLCVRACGCGWVGAIQTQIVIFFLIFLIFSLYYRRENYWVIQGSLNFYDM